MREALGVCGLIMGLTWPSHAGPPADAWSVRVLRMEGAAVSVRESAESLQSTCSDVARLERIQQVARMRSAADQLHKRVVSAQLAASVLHEGIEARPKP